MKRIFTFIFSVGFLLGGYNLSAQTYNYTNGALSVDVIVSNACDGLDNGSLTFNLISAIGGDATLNIVSGPAPVGFQAPSIILTVGVPYLFEYDSAGTPSTIVTAGDYDFIISDGPSLTINTFSANSPVMVDNLAPIEIEPIQTDNSSCVTPNGEITVNLKEGSGSYTYTWSGPNGFTDAGANTTGNPITISGLEGGTYTITVDDDYSNCSASLDVILANPTIVVTANTKANTICVGTFTGEVDIDVSGGEGANSFNWTGPNGFTSTDEDLFDVEHGTYTVTVTDGISGCVTTESFDVANNTPTIGLTVDSNIGHSSCLVPNGALSITPTGGTSYTFSWTGPNSFSSTSEDISGLEAGDYSVTITDDVTGCFSTTILTVADDRPALLISLDTNTPNTNCTTPNGAIEISVSNGTGYSYSWTGPNGFTSTTEDLSGLVEGTYDLIVTDDASGCTETFSVVVADNKPIIDITLDSKVENTSCVAPNGSISITPTGGTGYTYSWTGPNGFTSADEDLTNLEPGSYDVTVTDVASTCTAILNVVVDDLSPAVSISVDATADNTSCVAPNGSIDITVTGGTSWNYSWTGPNGFTSTNEDISGLEGGTYDLTVTEIASGCTATEQVIIADNIPNLNLALDNNTDNTSCTTPNGSLEITVTGGTSYSYSWTGPNGFTSTDEDIFNLEGGSYDITITEVASGCTISDNYVVTDNIPTIGINLDNNINNTNCLTPNGELQITATGGTGYTYSWTGPNGFTSTDEDLSGLVGGDYTVTVTDIVSNCSDMATYTVTDNLPAINVTVDATTDYSSCITPNGSIDITVSGGTGYSFSWTGPNGFTSTDEDLTGLEVGVYDLTVTDVASDCSTTTSAEIFDVTPTINVTVDNTTDNTSCTTPNGSANITVTGGGPNYTFDWSLGGATISTDEDPTGLIAGTYDLTVTDDASGCFTTLPVTINDGANSPVITADLVADNNQCSAPYNGEIQVTITNGSGNYLLSWTGPNGFTANSEDISTLEPGSYSLTVTDQTSGCVVVESYTVNDISVPLAITIDSKVDVTNCTSPDGEIMISVTGGTNYEFSWTGPNGFTAISKDIFGLEPGDYTVLVNETNTNCSSTETITLLDNTPAINITVDNVVDNTDCSTSNGSIEVTATGGAGTLSYAWTSPGGFTSTDEDIFGLIGDDYTLVVTDDVSGCTATITQQVQELASPITANGAVTNNSSCTTQNGAIDLTVSGNGGSETYLWTGPNGFTADTQDITDLEAGNYTVTIEESGCTTIATFTVGDDSPVIDVTPITINDQTSCLGPNGSIDIDITGVVNPTISWTSTLGFTSSDEDIIDLFPDDYTVTVTDPVSGCFTTQTYTVANAVVLPSINLDNLVHNTSCSTPNGAIFVTLTGSNLDIGWTGPAGFTSTNEDISGLVGGDYSLTVTDNVTGCVATATYTVDELASPITITDFNKTDNSDCVNPNGSITINVTGVTGTETYSWTGPNGFTADTKDINGLEAGDYFVTVTENGCSSNETVQILDDTPAITITLDNLLDNRSCTTPNGVIEITVTGATNPTYSWTSLGGFFASTEDISSLAADTYTITVTDGTTGCSVTETYTVNDNQPNLVVSGTTTANNSCAVPNGSIVLDVTGGFGGETYSWTGPNGFTETTKDINGLEAGDYQVTVDENGCQVVLDFTVDDLTTVPTITIDNVADNTDCVNPTGSIDITVTDATNYSVSWAGNAGFTSTDEDLTGLVGDFYTVTVTNDDTGCSSSQTVEVVENASPIQVTAAIVENTGCAFYNGEITLTVSGTNGGESYSWSGPNGFSTISKDIFGLEPGDYTVSVSEDGCVTNATFSVPDNPIVIDITEDVIASNTVCVAPFDGSISITATNGDGNYTYDWTGPNDYTSTDEDPVGLESGTYTVVVTDGQGCSGTADFTVGDATPAPIITVDVVTDNTSCTTPYDGTIEVTITGGSGDYSYLWSGPLLYSSDQEDIIDLYGGDYTLIVTDNVSGCFSTTVITLNNPGNCPANCSGFSFTFDNILPSCGSDNGVVRIDNPTLDSTPLTNFQVTLLRSGDTTPRIEPNPTNNTISGLQAGDYRYEILDFNSGKICVGTFPLNFETSVQANAHSFVDAPCFGENTGQAVLEAFGSATGEYFYSYDNGTNWIAFTPGNVISDLPPNGTFNIFVAESTDDSCPDLVEVTINSQSSEIFVDYFTTETTCTAATGTFTLIGVTGGTGGFTGYKLDGNPVDINTVVSNLSGGAHELVVTADNGCTATFEVIVPFPGLVNFDILVIDPNCSSNTASNGEILVDITDVGNFDVGISASQTIPPVTWTNTLDQAVFEDIAQGEYYIHVKEVGSDCATVVKVEVIGGPTQISFSAFVECGAGGNGQVITLENITGESATLLTIEVFKLGSTTPAATIDLPSIPAGNFYQIENEPFLTDDSEYLIQLSQAQSSCGGSTIISELVSVVVRESLTAEVLSKTVSYPDKPNGTMVIGNFKGGRNPYRIDIVLRNPKYPNQVYNKVDVMVPLNQNLDYEILFEDMPAGGYDVLVKDDMGCEFYIAIEIDVDTELLIPNIFTPNDDNSNDVFFIRNLPPEGAKITISNRWGNQVFESKSYQNDWDGKGASDGIYFYVLDIEGEVSRGWVEIYRGVKPGN